MKNNARASNFGFAPRLAPQPASDPVYDWVRPDVRGKFLWIGQKKFYVRGVTYGPFQPDKSGDTYPAPEKVERDFNLMAAHGINAIRTYNAPPRWLLDLAQQSGLRVLVGLQGERHFAFLDDSKAVSDIKNQIVAGTRRAAGHRLPHNPRPPGKGAHRPPSARVPQQRRAQGGDPRLRSLGPAPGADRGAGGRWVDQRDPLS